MISVVINLIDGLCCSLIPIVFSHISYQQTGVRFKKRQDRLQEFCNSENSTHDRNTISKVVQITKGPLTFCRIHKVASTYLIFVVLSQIHSWMLKTPHLNEAYTDPPKQVVFVRNPYGRLISGYLSRVLLRPSFWPRVGHNVMKMSGSLGPTSKWTDKCAVHATFPEFIRYFIQSDLSGQGRDGHFIPLHDQCGMCSQHYDYIGHVETIDEDLSYILKSVSIDLEIHNENLWEGELDFILHRDQKFIKACSLSNYTMLRTLWYSYHVTGFVSDDISFPLTEAECRDITVRQFVELVNSIREKSGAYSPREQRRKWLMNLYQQVPIQERLQLKSLLDKDFGMFDFDPQPKEVFPV